VGLADTLKLAMQKCLQCNSLLRSDETVCFSCDAVAPNPNPPKTFGDYFRTILNGLVIFMTVMEVGALLASDYFPSFKKTSAVLGILILVKKSADHMGEYRSDT
jgi:hypothetical protein